MRKRLLKDTAIYGIANGVQKLVPFFVVPLVVRALGQEALKIYDVAFVYAYLFSWLLILGQDSAASLLFFDRTKTDFHKGQVLRYGLLLQIGLLLAAGVLLLPFAAPIAAALFAADETIARYWLLALAVVPGHLLLNYALNILLWQKRKKEYVALCLCQTLLSLASVGLALLVFNGGLTHLFLCTVGSNALCGLLGFGLTWKALKTGGQPANKTLLKKLIWLGVPFALTSFLHQALPALDRLFLLQFGYQQQLPQYVLAVKLGALINLGVSAFVLAFTPYSLAKLNEKGAEAEISSLFRTVAVTGFALVPLALLFRNGLVLAFADASFAESETLLPFFFFGWLFDLFSYFSMLGVYKAQNSVPVLLFFAAGVALLCVLNLLLVPRLGLYGAALAFCLSKAALFFAPLLFLRRHFRLSVHVASFGAAGAAAALCSYLLYKTEGYVSILATAALLGCTTYYLYQYKANFLQTTKSAS